MHANRSAPLLVALSLALPTPRCGQAPPAEAAPSAPPPSADGAATLDATPGKADDAVALGARASHPLALAGGPQDVWLYVPLRGAERESTPRLALNLALVIDRSGSMASEDKLVFAKSAAEQVVGRLRPDDRLAIVTYDTDVETVVPSTFAGERDAFRGPLRALEPGDQTNLCGGLLRGIEEVAEHFDPARLNRVVLLSDGLVNSGVTDPAEIRRHASACRERGLRVSTMGMGLSYDERLMSGIAQDAGGNYYYVDQAESVGAHLDRELDELGRVVARDLRLRVALGEGVELVQVYGYASALDGRTAVVPVEDVYAGERKKVVLHLRASGAAGSERTLARVALRWVDAASGEARTAEEPPLAARFSESVAEVEAAKDREVLVKAEIVRNARAMDEAMALQKQGNFEGAQSLLAARWLNSKTLNDAEYRNEELARMLGTMQRLLQDIERTRHDASARRHVQLLGELQGLGYAGGD